jgi:uncharacterized spore protein YtfJ
MCDHVIHQSLMVVAETFSKMLDTKSIVTWPITQEDFIAYGSSESFK